MRELGLRGVVARQAEARPRSPATTADRPRGSRRPPLQRRRPEPALGRRPDLRPHLVGVRLRRVHHRRLLTDDRRLAGLPLAPLRPRPGRPRAGDLGPLRARPPPRRTGPSLRQGRAISRDSLHRAPRRDRRGQLGRIEGRLATTTPSPRRSSGSTRPSSSATAAPGAASTTSSTPPSNGSTGSTTAASSKPTDRSRPPSTRPPTTVIKKAQASRPRLKPNSLHETRSGSLIPARASWDPARAQVRTLRAARAARVRRSPPRLRARREWLVGVTP